MSEKEVIEQLERIIEDFNIGDNLRVNATDVKALQMVLQLLEQKDNRINELVIGIDSRMEAYIKDSVN